MSKQIRIILLLLIFVSVSVEAQKKGNDSNPPNIETTVITLDLSKPHINSLTHSMNKKKLVVKNNSPLAFVLIKGNPFRYRYVLNYKKINLFQNVEFDPKPEGVKKESNKEVTPSLTEGLADVDGDGIADDNDACPEETGFKFSDGCPKDFEEVKKEVINSYENVETLFNELTNDIREYRKKISTLEVLDNEELNNRIKEFKAKYKQYLNHRSSLNELFSDINLSNEDIAAKIGELDEAQESARLAIEGLMIKANMTYLHPIDLFGDNIDYVEIILEIYDEEKQISERYPFKIWLRGGLKIDVSGGIMVTSLLDNQYFTTEAANGEKFIKENDNGGYEFGFGSMVNINFRGGSWFRPALNVGVIFTSDQQFQLLTGLGFILGKNERFIFHTGLAMGRVSELRNDLLADGMTSFDLGTEGNVPVVEKFKFGHYFGVTYNFTKAKPKQPEPNK